MDPNDRLDVHDAIVGMFTATDGRDWPAVVDCFEDEVDVDYTSLTGGEPGTVARQGLVDGWQANLGGLEATQHLIGNVLVHVDGDEATATAHGQATHVLSDAHADSRWTLGCHYDFRLRRRDGRWRIAAMKMTATWGAGNQALMARAAAGGA